MPSASFLPTQSFHSTAYYCSSDQESLYVLQNPDIQYVRLSLKPAICSYHKSDKCIPHFLTGFLHAYLKIILPSKPRSSNYIPFTFPWSKTFRQFTSPMRATCPYLANVNNGKVLFEELINSQLPQKFSPVIEAEISFVCSQLPTLSLPWLTQFSPNTLNFFRTRFIKIFSNLNLSIPSDSLSYPFCTIMCYAFLIFFFFHTLSVWSAPSLAGNIYVSLP